MIGEALKPCRRAADIIEAAGLDSTIVRPAWLTDSDEVDYETTTETGLLSAMSAVWFEPAKPIRFESRKVLLVCPLARAPPT